MRISAIEMYSLGETEADRMCRMEAAYPIALQRTISQPDRLHCTCVYPPVRLAWAQFAALVGRPSAGVSVDAHAQRKLSTTCARKRAGEGGTDRRWMVCTRRGQCRRAA